MINAQSGTLDLTGGYPAGADVTNDGTLETTGGILYVTTPVTGTGSVSISGGGTASFQNTFDQDVNFSGTGTLALADPSAFQATMSGLATGDTIDLTGIASSDIASVTIDQSSADAGTIVVIETGGTQLSFNYTGNLSGDQFAPTSAGQRRRYRFGADSKRAGRYLDNSAGGDWSDALDWTDGLPSANDDADIGVNCSYTVTVSSDLTVAGLTTISTVTLDITGALSISGPKPAILPDPSTIAAACSSLDGAAVTTGSLTNNNDLLVDPSDYNGGSSLTVDGTLTNSGMLQIGNSYLTSPTMFGSGGEITGIASDAQLSLSGTQAFIADSSDTSGNSALTGLSSNAGALNLEDGAAIATTGTLTNSGALYVDTNDYAGGSSLMVDSTLTNSDTLQIGNSYLTSPTMVTVAGLDNTGSIYLYGGSDEQAALMIGGAAGYGTSGILSGDVSLQGDTLIEFGSGGEITGIASDAQLSLSGTQAFIADSSDTSGNSALTGLSSNAGALNLEDGAAIATTGTLTNSGALYVDTNDYAGGSSLTVDGTLTNSGTLQIGNSYLSSPTTVTVDGIDNTGFVTVDGNVTGQTSTLDVTGSCSGPGSFDVNGGVSVFGGSVATGVTVTFTGSTGTLIIEQPSTFEGQIAGISGSGDVLDLEDLTRTMATYSKLLLSLATATRR